MQRQDPQEDPVLLITGASTGIGAATARRAATAGYRLALVARRTEGLSSLAAQLGGQEQTLDLPCDVSEWDQQEAMVGEVMERFHRIDAVFANAGISTRMGLLEGSPERWREMVLTNILGTAFTVRATLPHLLDRGSGHYILTSSLAARKVVPGSLYAATKAAVSSFAEALRAELRQMRKVAGIRVTLLEPGSVATEMTSREQIPFEQLDADDVARAVLYALEQPSNVDLAQVAIRPAGQPV
jgi:NADP-dependent 3-hydroxy acid dehydrogenase YdfG